MTATQLDDAIADRPGGTLHGRIRIPGDKSVSHRAVMLGAIARSPLRDRFRFAVFYELSDAREPFFWPPPSEGSFGLLRLDGSRKPAYEAFREVVGLTRDRQAGIRHKSLQSTAWPIE